MRILQGVGYPFTVWETIQVVQSQQSDTMILDGFAPRPQKHLGLPGIPAVRRLLNQPLTSLPAVNMGCLHMPSKKRVLQSTSHGP